MVVYDTEAQSNYRTRPMPQHIESMAIVVDVHRSREGTSQSCER